MKLSQKTLAIFLSAIMIQSAVMTSAISVSADEEVDPEQIVTEIPDDDPFDDEPVIIPDEQIYKNWSFIQTENGVMIIRYAGNETDVEIPAYINDSPVVAIGRNAFRLNRKLKSVVIPDSVMIIADNAFRNCTALENIENGQNVTAIGNHAFDGCKSLTHFALMFELQTVGVAAFKDCCALQDIMLYKVKEVSPYTFWGCSSMQYINSVETIKVGEFAFYGCKSLTRASIIAGENIDETMTIDPMAFAGCTELRYVHFHWADKVNVRPSAFYNCKNIETVYYSGSEERWNENVTIAKIGNYYLTNAELRCDNLNFAELDEQEKEMQTGETAQLTYHSAPYVGYDDSVNIVGWQSSNPDVADVDENGNVTAKSAGFAMITLKSASEGYMDNESYCMITVLQSADSVALNKTAMNMGVGQKYTLQATVSPAEAPQVVKWKTSDKKIASVSADGTVTAKRTGTVTITAVTANGKTATCKVNVRKAPESISLNKTELTLKEKTTYTFTKTLSPTNSATSYKWESSNPDVAKVYSNGKIVTLKAGTTVITVTTHNGKTASCTVTVQ